MSEPKRYTLSTGFGPGGIYLAILDTNEHRHVKIEYFYDEAEMLRARDEFIRKVGELNAEVEKS